MDQEQFLQAVAQVMSDETALPVEIDIKRAWLLVSALQLVTRHPGIDERQTALFEQIGRTFQEAIVALHPEAAELIEMGWHQEFDVDEDGNPVNDDGLSCSHENQTAFVSPTTGNVDLGCTDCGEYLDYWDGQQPAPDWVPKSLRDVGDSIRSDGDGNA